MKTKVFSSFILLIVALFTSVSRAQTESRDSVEAIKVNLPKKVLLPQEIQLLFQKRLAEPLSNSQLLRRDTTQGRMLGGGQESGGGTVVSFKDQCEPVLLDFIYFDPDYSKQMRLCAEVANTRVSTAKDLSRNKLERLSAEDQVAFDIAYDRLESWKLKFLKGSQFTSAAVMTMLTSALRGTTYRKINREFKLNRTFEWPKSLTRSKPTRVDTAILFLDRFGALISAPVWSSLTDETKAGLLIHEAFRQIQYQYGFHDILDRQIQFVTAIIMLVEPIENFGLEPFLSDKFIRNCRMRGLAVSGGANSLVAEIFARHQEQFEQTLNESQSELLRKAMNDSESSDEQTLRALIEKYAR